MNRDDPYIVLVTGSRNWRDRERIHADLLSAERRAGDKEVLVVHGGCKGADLIAHGECGELGIHTAVVPALWGKHSRSAGPLRNSVMASMFEYDEVLKYPLPGSKGTHDMARKARLRNA